jgi:hypothetical protein
MRLFHISETPGIKQFIPRPSPSHFKGLTNDVVFAISEDLLHNYLLPRDCPRVTYYAGESTTANDQLKFMRSSADYVMTIEEGWRERIVTTTLYCYEFDSAGFRCIDKGAGYYVSESVIEPIKEIVITDAIAEICKRKVELMFIQSLVSLADEVRHSTLNFSLIRMRNVWDIDDWLARQE